jgi:hypothetical protein
VGGFEIVQAGLAQQKRGGFLRRFFLMAQQSIAMGVQRVAVGSLIAPAEIVNHAVNIGQGAYPAIEARQSAKLQRKRGAGFSGQDGIVNCRFLSLIGHFCHRTPQNQQTRHFQKPQNPTPFMKSP